MLTVQILTRNNRDTIERCLESALKVGDRVVVGDLGSSDGTDDLCSKMGAEVSRIRFSGDFSEARNLMVCEGMNMYLEPWEFISSGIEDIKGMDGNFALYVFQGGMISKQVRLWKDGVFRNPVFEYVDCKTEAVVRPEVLVSSLKAPDNRAEMTKACKEWVERRPTSPEPHYYLACSLLAEGRLEEFMACAERYLSIENTGGDSAMLMNYYASRVELSMGRTRQASKRAIACVSLHPSFAEFWCLLGDLFYSSGAYRKAMSMYQNARIIGRRRRTDDMLPIELSKYGPYPQKMIEACRSAIKRNLVVVGRESNTHR